MLFNFLKQMSKALVHFQPVFVTELQDTKLLTQIGTEDLIAKEAKYY